MKQAFVQVHFIKFAPLKAAKPRLDFILLPPAEVGSWQDPPGFSSCSLSRAREGEGSMLRDLSYTNGKALGTAACPCGSIWVCLALLATVLALPAQRSPWQSQGGENSTCSDFSGWQAQRSFKMLSSPSSIPTHSCSVLVSGLFSFRATSPLFPPVTTVLF